MRCLNRNKQTFHYALYLRKQPCYQIDEYGNTVETGEYRLVYDNPVLCNGNISAATGETVTQLFGANESYDKIIMLENPNIPIDEYSILWVDSIPEIILEDDGEELSNVNGGVVIGDDGHYSPHDYVVKRIARSLNSVTIAIRKVNVRS